MGDQRELLRVSVCMCDPPRRPTSRPVAIFVDQPIPSAELREGDFVKNHEQFFQKQALLIVDALQASLPGGTLDRVQAELCRRRAVNWVVNVNG